MKQRTLSRNLNAISNGVEGEDYIVCQICKKPYKILMDCGHLKEHNITSEEYKKLFPNAKMSCEKSKVAKSIGISSGRKKLMLERGYLNPQSQRDSKRAEMIKRHLDKKQQS
jgi:predicted transcriptional regulator